MSLANWTTHFLAPHAQGDEMQPAGRSAGAGASADGAASPPPPGPRSLVGSRVGAYLITKRLGAGGVGEVFKGIDVMLKRDVAIKVLRPELAADPLFLERFRHEAQLLAQLGHPNIASVHAFLHEADMQFMVMEYVPGISLDEFVRAGGPVPVQRALEIFRRVLDGIGHAHRCGIVHRDIKPANIMLADNGQVKVMDFGIARALANTDRLTRAGQVAGTAKAMSPEQVRGEDADVRSDIYSLGIVLYTLLAGRAPFDGQSDYTLMKSQVEQAPPPLHGFVAHVPPQVEAMVMRALEKHPSDRFQTVEAFARAVDAGLAAFATAPAPLPQGGPEAPTVSRTVVNAALPEAPALPRPLAPSPARTPGRLRRRAGIALTLPVLLAGALWGWNRLAPHDSPSERTSAAQPAAPRAPAALPPPEATPAVATAPAMQPAQPGSAVPPPRLTITRLPSEGSPGATAQAAMARDSAAAASETAARFMPGERIRLLVTPGQDAHVYCYLQDEAQRIVRFHPSRFSPSALVKAAAPLEIPGRMGFELVANTRQVPETVACFSTGRDVMPELPAAIAGTDFEGLRAASLDEVRDAFARAAGETLAEARFRVEFR